MTEEVSRKQPKQLYMLFFAEMWERFSYYGMRALLILFMLSHFKWDDGTAYGVYGAYGAMVYATPFIGGVIADRILGNRSAVMFGAVLMAIGHFVMAFPDFLDGEAGVLSFYTALAFLIIGNGFFKPNISSIVGGLYKEGDPRRDAGFTIFYMGVNLGAFLAPLVCGTIGEVFGWSYGFSLAGFGMLVGLFVFGRGVRGLGDNGKQPEHAVDKKLIGLPINKAVYLITFLFVPLVVFMLMQGKSIKLGLVPFAFVVLGIILVTSFRTETKEERERLWVVLVMIVFSTMFWAFFEQAGSSITLFTDRNVDKGFLPTTIFQSVNPLFILIFGPVFSGLWLALARKGRDLSVPTKFALGILQLGLGFLIMVFGAKTATEDGMVGLIWLLLGYLLHTTGELCLSPVGLSMVTKLSPRRIIAMTLGAWYISSSLAHLAGGMIASATSTEAYMEAAISYEPRIGAQGLGTHQVKFNLSETKLIDLKTNKIVTDAEILKTQKKKLDTLAYRKDVYACDEITLNVHVVDDHAQLKPNFKPETYNIYRSTKPTAPITLNARIQHLDPIGDLTEIKLDKNPQYGKVELKGDTLTYTPNPDAAKGVATPVVIDTAAIDSMGLDSTQRDSVIRVMSQPQPTKAGYEDVIEYTMCQKENPSRCDRVRIVVTVDEEENHKPKAIKTTDDVYIMGSTALAKTSATFNVLDYVYDADGDALSIEITQKPGDVALVGDGEALNSFVTAAKTVHIYSYVFRNIGLFCLAATLVLLCLVPILKKWMHGVK